MDVSDDSKGFIKHVFNFDSDSKSDMLNILQYTLLALIPVIVLNKLMQKYVPEADDKKASLELIFEVLVQLIVMIFGILLVHRLVTYVPTYSGVSYVEFNVIYIVLVLLMITLSLQTKLGEKVSILVDRLNELWDGKTSKKSTSQSNQLNGSVKVSQPLSGNQAQQQPTQQSGYVTGTSISSLPNLNEGQPIQQLPNYDNMYRQDNTPLINANTPGLEGQANINEPLAASEFLGGSFSGW